MTSLLEHTDALFSPCRTWRYRLWRVWDATLPRALFVLMNPSTADEVANDPTVERCRRRVLKWNATRAHRLGPFGGVEVVNVFAWRETNSDILYGLHSRGVDIVGPENDAHIIAAALGAKVVVCGWGQPGNLGGRGRAVLDALRVCEFKPHALALNADNTPRHPLYIGYDAPLIEIP